MALTLKQSAKEFKPHTHMHHVVINAINVIIAMLTLCYSIMSHAKPILYYHTSMLTLRNSLYHVHFVGRIHDIREVRVYHACDIKHHKWCTTKCFRV